MTLESSLLDPNVIHFSEIFSYDIAKKKGVLTS